MASFLFQAFGFPFNQKGVTTNATRIRVQRCTMGLPWPASVSRGMAAPSAKTSSARKVPVALEDMETRTWALKRRKASGKSSVF